MSKLAAVLFVVLVAAGAQAQTPRSAKDFHERGSERYARGDYEGAIADFTAFIDLSSSLGKGKAGRSNWSAAAGGADDGFGRARVLDPEAAVGYMNRGVARLGKGDYDGAFADYEAALRLAPRDARVYYNRGDARRVTGDTAGALADYEQAMRLDPRYADAYHGRGMLKLTGGDHAGAESDFTKALSLNGKLALAYANRGLSLLLQRKDAAAESDFRRALELDPRLREQIEGRVGSFGQGRR